jgi:hypothetical protein
VVSRPDTTAAPTSAASPAGGDVDTSTAVVQGAGVPDSMAPDVVGAFRLICTPTGHLSYDDPIVYPGQPGKSHLHTFFGNTQIDANSTYQSLLATGDSTCDGGPVNRTGYWVPTLLNGAGSALLPDFVSVYYKETPAEAKTLHAHLGYAGMPRGLKLLGGFDMTGAHPLPSWGPVWWACESTGIHESTIPTDCNSPDRIGMIVNFPDCWDGVNLDSPDHRTHVVYYTYVDGVETCPAGYDYRIPTVAEGVWYRQDGHVPTWSLSSDAMPDMTMPPGSTEHADWFGAWNDTIIAKWFTGCIEALLSCSGGQLGDGTGLKQHPAVGPTTVAVPAQPTT